MTLDEAIGILEELKQNRYSPEILEALIRAQQALSVFAVLERIPHRARIDLDHASTGEWHCEFNDGDLLPAGRTHWGSDALDALAQLTTALALEGL